MRTPPVCFELALAGSGRDYRCYVNRVFWRSVEGASYRLCVGRGSSPANAVKAAHAEARTAMRLERDERARLALSRNVAMAELASLAGQSCPVSAVRAAATDPAVLAVLDLLGKRGAL